MRAEECLWENALSVHSSANVIRLLTYSVISQVCLKEKGGLMVPNGGKENLERALSLRVSFQHPKVEKTAMGP
ncbi:hypothetical protein HZH68_011101 [Vespula germanica]|uniref:Uncharacterized protein n=1 Tax=Vespula germanica TaxID=30212 RepID=A0A834JMF9_VESGE|nr:hypothetical protein HZH68_011101 [Vespula germanica]